MHTAITVLEACETKIADTLCVFMQQLQDSAVVCKAVGTAVVYTALLQTQYRASVLAVP
jgi:hypothetical protein